MAKVPRGFGRFLLRGAALLKNPRLLKQMLAKAVSKMGRAEGGPLREVREQLAVPVVTICLVTVTKFLRLG